MSTPDLKGRVALVTGAGRGVGRGVAEELISAGARVYVTGRNPRDLEYAGDGAIVCDHRDDSQVESAFERMSAGSGLPDILVNNVWGGYENMVENGEFTWPLPFWKQPMWRWDAMFQSGVRAHYFASRLAAPAMIERGTGLIVNISFWAARKHIGNMAYGVSKAATDKMTSDMAHELREHNVAAVSLYPGLVRTEKVMESAAWLDLSNSESPRFTGRAVVALANDPQVINKSGSVLIAAELAIEYGFTDIDGARPRPLSIDEV